MLYALELDCVMVNARVAPNGSVARRPIEATAAKRPTPAVLELSEAWPCPLAAIDGIQKKRGLEAAGSNMVPDWIRLGVVDRLPIWYQRSAVRSPPLPPTPLELTLMLWAVHSDRLPLGRREIIASNSRSSSASRSLVLPWAGTFSGK